MKDFENKIDTGLKWFGQRIFLQATGDETYDGALKRLFIRDYTKSGPLSIDSLDAKIVLAGQGALFE